MSFITIKHDPIKISGGTSPHELTKRLSHVLYNEVMENFDSEGRPKWQPLKPKTKKQRIARGFGDRPVLDRKRGALGLRGGIIEAPTEDKAIVGARAGIPYAGIHQSGGEIKRYPRSSTVRLRTDKKGNLKRQIKSSNLAVFAKKKHKLAKTVRYTINKIVTINIPARPYLSLTSDSYRRLRVTVKQWFEG